MRGVVPDSVLDRRDKIGFATPERRWFDEVPPFEINSVHAISRPLPACFARGLGKQLQAVAERRAPYGPEVWRCWNVVRWAELLRLEFPA